MENMKEKRSTPRIEEKLPIRVAEGDYQAVVETKNVSASGVYFITEKPMPLMSKVVITLLLPGGPRKNTKIECSGTVVRVVPVPAQDKTTYETAIFFDDITEKSKNIISRHVKRAISQDS